MSGLHIADGLGEDRSPLALPAEVVTQAIGILARRGAGKTHTATVLVEEVIGAGLPVVVLDPTGAWWGLRSSADGDSAGLPVVILGGEHGDVPLERTAGKVIADLVIDHPGAFVIDLSGFESRAAEQTFAADFLERLYRGKATKRDPLLVVVDEADNFAPQRPGSEQLRTLGALEAIIRRGRIRGLGAVLISQRAAVINKNVLTQIEVLIALQTTAPQDRAAVKEWVLGHASKDEAETFADSLAGLGRGEAWVWSPSWLRILRKVQIRQRRTFDSSKTPEAGGPAAEPRAFATVDLDALGKQIAATVEQAKANDPAALRRRIAELERRVTATPEPEVRVERVEVPVLNGQVGELRSIVGELRTIGEGMIVAGTGLAGVADSILTAVGTVQRSAAPPVTRPAPERPIAAPRPPVQPRAERADDDLDDRPMKLAERRVLAALAQYPQGRTTTQVAILAGYAWSGGGFRNALGALRSAGRIEGGKDRLLITDAGLAALGDDWTPLPTGRALLDHWLGNLDKLAERKILSALADAYPNAIPVEELGPMTGYEATGGGFRNALGKLRTLELIERGTPRMSDNLA